MPAIFKTYVSQPSFPPAYKFQTPIPPIHTFQLSTCSNLRAPTYRYARYVVCVSNNLRNRITQIKMRYVPNSLISAKFDGSIYVFMNILMEKFCTLKLTCERKTLRDNKSCCAVLTVCRLIMFRCHIARGPPVDTSEPYAYNRLVLCELIYSWEITSPMAFPIASPTKHFKFVRNESDGNNAENFYLPSTSPAAFTNTSNS